MTADVVTFETLDADRVARREPFGHAIRRRLAGRYPVDPFGLDPQLADLVMPAVAFAVPVHVEGGEHVPQSGPACIVANRGFGVFEPAALGVAVTRASGRRLRIASAPALPFIGSLTRRLGALGASEQDVAVALRAGHLVGVPLAPTWLRTGAGIAPQVLMPAVTHAPIIPAAVTPAGPFGTSLSGWRVRFGSIVTLDVAYDPDDPLAVARFADAMRGRVSDLLARQ